MTPRPPTFRRCGGVLALVAAACKPGLLVPVDDAGVGPFTGCTSDTTVDCAGGGYGFTCPAGDNPELFGPGVSCSEPVINPGGNEDYCCFRWTYGTSTCTPDDDLTAACSSGSYGYQCVAPTDDPTSLDPGLHCGAPTPDFDGRDTDFCCTSP